MKIAVYHNLPPGGAKRAVYEEVKYLSKNHELHLFRLDSTDESFLDIRKYFKSVKIYEFDIKSKFPGYFKRLDRDFQNFITLRKLHKRIAQDINSRNFDVFLTHPDRFTQAPFLLHFVNIPSLYFCEEYLRIAYEKELEFNEDVVFYKKWYEQLTRKYRKKIDKDNARHADLVVANSRFTKKNIEDAYGIEANCCHLGVDVNMFKKVSNKRGNYLLYIGEKNRVGAISLIEKAVENLKTKNKLQIKTLGFLKGKLNVINDRILAEEYSEALATVCTSYNEPFGLAPIESMTCGTPVLAVNEGGYRETVVDGVTGFLLPRDPKMFAAKIEFLRENPDIVDRMGKAGREHVKKNFTWEKHVKCVEKHLYGLVKQKRS